MLITTFLLAGYANAQQSPVNTKQIISIKTPCSYKRMLIENLVPTADLKGAMVQTADGKTWFLDRKEAKDSLGLIITNMGWAAPQDARVIYYDKNGVPGEGCLNTSSIKGQQHLQNVPKQLIFFHDSLIQPIFIVDGNKMTDEEMRTFSPENIKSMNLLKSDNAVQLYGNNGRNGVMIITTNIGGNKKQ